MDGGATAGPERTVLITGGSRGIGAATARAFSRLGASVAIAARASDELDALCSDTGALQVVSDVRDPAQVAAMVETVRRVYGRLDVVVCAAGIGRFGPIESLRVEDWDELFAVNLRGAFLTCQAALPALLGNPSGGHIITIASVAATRPFPDAAAYCASKFGLLGFTRVLAEEVRRRGVKVTALLPGSVDSPFWEAAGGTSLPRGEMLRPEDVASAIVFVTSQTPTAYVDELTVLPRNGVL